jgi:hypothetical protein
MNYSIYSGNPIFWLRALVFSALFLNLATAADFGVADWGMSPDDVRALETRTNITPFGVSDYLIFSVTLPAIDKTRIVYQFNNGQLVEGRFLFMTSSPLAVSKAINQYDAIKTMISGQYGPPNTDEIIPANSEASMTMGDVNSMANELASDRLLFKSSWRSQSATIRHQLAWNTDKPHHQLHYMPLALPAQSSSVDAF